MARIKQKIKQGQTKEITEPAKDEEEKPRTAQVIDLAELLKQSLGKGGGAGKAARARPPRRARNRRCAWSASSRGATKTRRRKRKRA